MAPVTFIKSLLESVEANDLIPRGAGVIVGVSGGPDSMALLHGLAILNLDHEFGLDLLVAHFNHCLRGEESDEDAAFVQAAADSLDLPCMIETGDANDRKGMSLEEFARQQRYRFFERACIHTRAKMVAVGHHADDNAETILHRILRGTGVRGLTGIPVNRQISPMSDVEIVRPILKFKKNQILEFLADHGIPFREDRTNSSTEMMRNRIRHEVLPLVEEVVNPQVRDALLRLGKQARWVDQYLCETAQRMFETMIISRNDQQLVLNVPSLVRKSPIIQTELIRRSIASFQMGQQDVGFSNLKAVVDLVSNPGSGKQVQLPGGMLVSKFYDRLIFSRPTQEAQEMIASEIAVHVPGRTFMPVRRLTFQCDLVDADAEEIRRWRSASHSDEEWADFDAVHLPLVIRTRRSGDRFWPLGAPGTKKLSEFLIDSKVSPAERDLVAVLSDQLGPVWIVGHRLDERVKLTRRTRRVLQMRVRPFGNVA